MDTPAEPALDAWNRRTTGVIKSDKGPNNWTFLLSTDAGEMVLRLYRTADEVFIAQEHRLLQLLQVAQLPFGVPAPLPTTTGTTTTQMLWQGRPVLAALFPMLPGRPPTDSNLTQAAAVGQAIGHLHSALAGLPGTFEPRNACPPINQIDPLVPDPVSAAAQCGRDHAHSSQLAQVVERTIASDDEVHNDRWQIIHADLFASNMLVADDEVSAILDFECAGVGPRLMDVAVATLSLCFTPLDGDNRWDLAGSLAAGYSSVHRGPMSEVGSIPQLLRRREVTSFVSRIGRHQRNEITTNELNRRAHRLIQLDHWLDSYSRQLIGSMAE